MKISGYIFILWILCLFCTPAFGQFFESYDFFKNSFDDIAPEPDNEQLQFYDTIATGGRLYDAGKYDEALKQFEQALKRQPYDNAVCLRKSLCLAKLHRFQESLETLDILVNKDPDNEIAWYVKASVLANLQQYEQALTAYDTAANLSKSPAQIYSDKGMLLFDIDRYAEAIEALEKALEYDASLMESREYLAIAYYRSEQYIKALKTIDVLIAEDSNNCYAWYNKAKILDQQGHVNEAIIACNSLLDLDPEFAAGWSLKGILLNKTHRTAQGAEAASRALELDKNQDFLWYNRACIYCIQGEKDKALFDLERALLINPHIREQAKNDDDFFSLWDDSDFIKLTD